MKVTQFPSSIAGKIDKLALLEQFKQSMGNERDIILPQDAVELRLLKIWKDLLSVRSISVDDDFHLLGGYSLLGMQLLDEINKEFLIELPLDWLTSNPTIQQQAQAIHTYDKKNIYSPLIHFHLTDPSAKNIFLIHPGGGSAIIYKELAKELQDKLNVYGVESYHLYHQDNTHTNIESLAKFYKNEIIKIDPQGPFYLGGWSLGGILAYEVAQQLLLEGKNVQSIFLLDTFLPNKSQRKTILSLENSVFDILEENGFFMRMPEYYRETVKNAIQIQTKACLHYSPLRTNIRVILLKSTQAEQIKTRLDTKQAKQFEMLINSVLHNKCNGWSSYATNLLIHQFEGDHESLVNLDRKKTAEIIIKYIAD